MPVVGECQLDPRARSKCCAAFWSQILVQSSQEPIVRHETEKRPGRQSARRLVDAVNFLIGNPHLSDAGCRLGWIRPASKLLNDM
jgi:hypothetical protein